MDEEVPSMFQAKVIQAKHGGDGDAYLRGYNAPSKVSLPGYFAAMSDVALMRLALDHHLSPEQLGALQRLSEQRVILGAQNNVSAYNKVLTGKGVSTTPTPQSYYLSMINQLSGGECAGFSHLLSLAVAEGKEHIFLGNIYQAVADPDAPESQAFFRNLAKVQGAMKNRTVAHDPATVKVAPYTTIAPQLTGSPTTKTLLISSEGHRLTAGVMVGPEGQRTYYYSDPNIGLTKFSTLEAFEDGLRKIFTDPRLKPLIKPLAGQSGEPKYMISVFNPNHVPETAGTTSDIKFMYDAPLGGLDKVSVINASPLPTSEDFRRQSPPSTGAEAAGYDAISQGLQALHERKGMPQYHQAMAVLGDVKKFIADHPNASQIGAMKALEQKLTKVINEAAAPADYPYIFERMEQDRASLAEAKMGAPLQSRTETVWGMRFETKARAGADPMRIVKATAAVDTALLKHLQSGQPAPKSVGPNLKVLIANPGDQVQTQLRLSNPPTLIIGDDFHASPSAEKQAALITDTLGALNAYKANPKAFLAAANNKQVVRASGDTPNSQRVKPLTTAVAPIDTAEVTRLQKLDDIGPPIRIGEVEVSRVELYKMGARIDGKPIDELSGAGQNINKQLNSIQIDYGLFEAYVKSGDSKLADRTTSVLVEIGSHRDSGAAPLMFDSNGTSGPEVLNKHLKQVHADYGTIQSFEGSKKPLASNFFSAPTPGQKGSGAGIGFQAFSTFQGIRSAIQSLQDGDTTAGAVGLAGVASDYVGMGAEVALGKVVQKAAASTAPAVAGFMASSIGKMIGKLTGTAGVLISLPFDIYNAVDSFKKAGSSTGKEAQDHYVNGAVAVSSAVTSIALGAAFLGGLSAAGPVGLAIAAALMTGQAIYSAVRTVEDINHYAPLSGSQKFSLGLQTFLGISPSFSVLKPYLENKYAAEYDKQKQVHYRAFLAGEGRNDFERVVYGSVDVEAKQVSGKVGLTPKLWYSPITYLLNLIKVPGKVPEVTAKEGSDDLSGKGGFKTWNKKPVNAIEGEIGEGKATLWDLGDGDDWVNGVEDKPNYFLLKGGKKAVGGGNADDTVVLNADALQTIRQAEEASRTQGQGFSPRQLTLNGGGGNNTLVFSGPLETQYKEGEQDKYVSYKGHVIDLKNNTLGVKTQSSSTEGVLRLGHIQSFSNVVTVEKGESFVRGDDANNVFVLNGDNDVAFTGKGDNVVTINGGATVTGEGGTNTYIIGKGEKEVVIQDPNKSYVRLDCGGDDIAGWDITPSGDLLLKLHNVDGKGSRSIVFKNAFSEDRQNGDLALPTFITNDGVMLSVEGLRKDVSSPRVPRVNRMNLTTAQ
ncbi:hypothetical protein [uncultured Pseudomonas sp.]|uniref:hypothetical protein n=1 Tax=uncultured Pseudomonas sp. TaxID=114707 RepID=UPI0025F6825B|nr:hypothetical protein [uncultured Pseudomonas sp.]